MIGLLQVCLLGMAAAAHGQGIGIVSNPSAGGPDAYSASSLEARKKAVKNSFSILQYGKDGFRLSPFPQGPNGSVPNIREANQDGFYYCQDRVFDAATSASRPLLDDKNWMQHIHLIQGMETNKPFLETSKLRYHIRTELGMGSVSPDGKKKSFFST